MPLEILNTLGTSGRITCWEQNYRSTYYVFLKSSMFGVTVKESEIKTFMHNQKLDFLFLLETDVVLTKNNFKSYANCNAVLPIHDENTKKEFKSRIVLLLGPMQGIKTTIRQNLMSDGVPSIWAEITKSNETFLIGSFYREWQDQYGDGSREGQRRRLNDFFEQVERAKEEKKKMLVLGDFNLDVERLNDKTYYERTMAVELNRLTVTNGLDYIPVGKTFSANVGTKENPVMMHSCIDHVYIGNGMKLASARSPDNGMSDHTPSSLK